MKEKKLHGVTYNIDGEVQKKMFLLQNLLTH